MQQLLLATARLHVVQDNAALETCLPIHMPPFTCLYVYVHVRTYVYVFMYACTYVHAPSGLHPHRRTLCVCTGTFGAPASV